MFKIKFFAAVLLVGILLSYSAPLVASATECDGIEFVSDLTIPDGTSFAPGTNFTKTWRLKNAGSCTWTTAYSLVLFSGEGMGAPASTQLSMEVTPNQQVDLSVNLTAPNTPGHYRGYWKLSNASSQQFGMGPTASDAFWVDINVVQTSAVVFDFVANSSYAQWKSGSGLLAYPGVVGDRRGYAYQLERPHLEDDSFDSSPGMLFVPQNKFNGYIQATYPEFLVQQGDQLQTLVNCEYGATNCYVTFQINYQLPNGYIGTLWSWREAYEGRYYRANIDLSSLAGNRVKFILMVLGTGYALHDRAIWGSPRIIRSGSINPPAPPPTLTPLPSLTPTTTPFSAPPPTASAPGCDRATFVTDVTIPDGSLFAPGTGFAKTWRIKNSGWCNWTQDYGLVFYAGEQMSAPTRINIPSTVYPGQAVDLTVNMAAPPQPGAYRGFWMLQNASGSLFGIGQNADAAFWVEVQVSGASPSSGGGYDFVANACAAEWKSYAGALPCPSPDGDRSGYVIPLSSTQLEDGTMGPAPSLLVGPEYRYNGYIQGFYPRFAVQPGDRFRANVGCAYGANCYVTFMLQYMTDTGWVGTLWSQREGNEGRTSVADIDLTPLAGRSVRFILTLLATGYPTNDRALWTAPYIVRAEAPQIPTQTSTATFTNTPTVTQPPVSNWPTYTNTKYGFQFKYPPEGQITSETEDTAHIALPIVEAGTNLKEKYLDVVVQENIDPCHSPLTSAQSTSETVTLNGITFLKETGGDGSAGSFHSWTAYSTKRGNACVSMDFVLHSTNPGVYTTPPPVYNEALESAIFDIMASTYTWLALPPTNTSTPSLTPTPTATSTATPTTPPTYNWPTYNNYKYGFEFKYPPEGQIQSDSNDNAAVITLPFQLGTNLSRKYLDLRVFEDFTTCAHPIVGPPMNPETIIYNGTTFLRGIGTDVGAGQIHNWIIYTTTRGNICVAMAFILHSTNPGNYATPPPVYDYAAESAVFQQMMETFVWPEYPQAVTPTPTATSQAGLQGPYAVVRINPNDVLNIREDAGISYPLVGWFPPTTTNIMRTGPTKQVNGSQWVEVQRPDGGLGWVNAYYLTEYVTHDAFCADMRIAPLIDQLKQAVFLSDAEQFASLVSPLHGVDIRLWAYQNPVNFSKDTAKTIFTSSTSYNWGSGPSGAPDIGTFANIIQPKMIDVFYASNKELYCDNLTKVYPLAVPWPYPNIRFYNLYKPATSGVELDYRTWLIGIEYINDQPYLYGMVTVVWEP